MTGFLVGLYIGVFVGIVGVCLFSMAKSSDGGDLNDLRPKPPGDRRLEEGPVFKKQNRWRG